ncbi:D-alanyl-D-alanine carboxypeptidase family protein [Paenibacillus sp. RC67]|uniref:D-alanyl-D-alanine carboxypeptidase family protein n=1 Tax=Paenibacillus sp. RC67 TaxID=3039392 RepID=UPI0024AE1B2F|nr:D-alanyl-D-alanine carboxypeptidase family protein [Paenibacillus sp. RC67]
MNKSSLTALLLASSLALFTGCEGSKNDPSAKPADTAAPAQNNVSTTTPNGNSTSTPGSVATSPGTTSPAPATTPTGSASNTGKTTDPGKGAANQVVAEPESISVLVNKQFALPEKYEPSDLVYPDVPFTFKEKIEKRKMRKEAAAALEKLFAGAKKDGIYLAGVSAYRSHATQKTVFNNYVKTDGEEKAKTYSAVPGHSEHETGLAIDVSGSDGKCAAQDCFGGTKEAEWLAKHSAEYGFIIRYLKGKESITGYQYEPWHIRYVGTQMAKEIASKGITLEEYLNAVPATK